MTRFGLFLCALPALAAVTNVSVMPTNTQAILRYQTTAANACTVQVSEKPALTPLVYDVDPAYFAGADQDSRAGNVSIAGARQFVIGKRTVEVSISKGNQSRALQADTDHYFSISCLDGTASGSFHTASVAFSNSYLETVAQDANNPALPANPLFTFARNQTFVDPLTGVQMQTVSTPQDRYIPVANDVFRDAYGTAWTTPTAALAASVSGTAGASIASSTAPLFLAANSETGSNYIAYLHQHYGENRDENKYSWNLFQPTITAIASGANAGPDDQKFTVCVTINGVACAPNAQTYTFQATGVSTAFVVGTGNVGDTLQTPGQLPIAPFDVATRTGIATCTSGTPTLTWYYYDDFAPAWTAGTPIKLYNGTTWGQYFVASTSLATPATQTITLTTNCTANYANVGGARNFSASTFGVLIAKKTASADTIKIQAATQTYQIGTQSNSTWTYSGSFDICSPTTVTGNNGDPGFNCYLNDNGGIYWIDSLTGETHLFARYFGYGGTDFALADALIFDANNPDVWYNSTNGTGGHVYRHQYTGNHLEPAGGGFNENNPLPACGVSPCVTVTELTKGIDIIALAADFEPQYQADRFLSYYKLAVLSDGKLVYRTWRGGAINDLGWTVVFDPALVSTANGCVGKTYAGSPGCVIAAMSSWKSPNMRWCGQKTNNETAMPGWLEVGSYPLGYQGYNGAGSGPWQVDVTDGTSFTTAAAVACPTNSVGAAGNTCINVTVSGEPYNANPCTASAGSCGGVVETNTPGEIGTAAPGDYATLNSINPNGPEEVMLVQKTDATHWIFQRAIDGRAYATVAANPKIIMACNVNPDPLNNGNNAGATFWNYVADPHATNAGGNTIVRDHYAAKAHFYRQAGRSTYATAQGNPLCNNPGINCYGNRKIPSTGATDYVNTPATAVISSDPFFAAKAISIDPNAVQMHTWGAGANTKGTELERYFYDGRPFNGGYYTGTVSGNGSNPGTNVGGYLWKFTAAQSLGLNRKHYYTYAYLGIHVLRDVSGPSSVIGQTTGDFWKYCVANAVNECVTGSAAGDVYVNGPNVTPYCNYPGQAASDPDANDVCIGDNSAVFNAITQMDSVLPVDNFGTSMRVLGHIFNTSRAIGAFFNAHAMPNGTRLLTYTKWINNSFNQVMTLKVPTATHDSINRQSFQDRTVQIAPPAGTNNVIVEFGYNEYGTVGGFPTCTTRAELCAVGNNTTGVQATPFYFLGTESASLTGTPCATACSVTIPALPAHVLYWRAIFRDAGNATLSTGATMLSAIP